MVAPSATAVAMATTARTRVRLRIAGIEHSNVKKGKKNLDGQG
jgi:hypothetical protein